jgi:hypothetical protein
LNRRVLNIIHVLIFFPGLAPPGFNLAKEMCMVVCRQGYIRSSRGVQLFTCRWLPSGSSSPRALVFLCHGIFSSLLVTSLPGVWCEYSLNPLINGACRIWHGVQWFHER